MLGVSSTSETRPDLHQGHSFFWYTDIMNPSFGTLGLPTPTLESLPPISTFSHRNSPVTVVLSYDGAAETLSASINGVAKGVIGTNIAPPVVPAFSFVGDDQRVSVHLRY
eukprot:TRINITY_DN24992_c0_g1_i1.p2 TRINITY_DN24992_c0_g1~~TRINITY_DN24992_c0_g1_i1.p2  ORF type:complete len:110 (+),score=22.33 TRINITY_DN24992_c0_g1_i1:185-514(+)